MPAAPSAPDVQFAWASDGARIAYQVVGEGPRDVVLCTDWGSSVDLMWELPQIERFLRRLSSVGRLILIDKRGNGASDTGAFAPGMFSTIFEVAASDLEAVLDAVDADQVDIVANTFGGWTAVLFAATHPERCGRLVLIDAFAVYGRTEDHPYGIPHEGVAAIADAIRREWGTGVGLLGVAPDLYEDPVIRRWAARYERLTVARDYLAACWDEMDSVDFRAAVPLVRAETLVIDHPEATFVKPARAGATLVDLLPRAELVELKGTAVHFWADESVIGHVLRFLTGEPSAASEPDDRVLAAVLFTDIVGSTPLLAKLGDARWSDLLDALDRLTDETVARHRGTLVTRMGDGLLATFDGPARAIRCAVELVRSVRGLGVEIRAGIHAGEIEQRADGVAGLAVHTAARVMDVAGPSEVVVSRTVKDLTGGSGLSYTDRGVHQLRGVPEEWQLYTVGPFDPGSAA